MKLSPRRLLILGIILVLTFFFAGCGAKEGVQKEEVVKSIPVEVVEVGKGEFTKGVVLSGTTKANAEVTVMPKISGAEKIMAVSVQVGDKVSAGQTIALLDQSSAEIQLNTARTTYEDTLRDYEKNKTLYESGAVSKSVLEKLEVALTQAKNALAAQELAYSNLTIKSPINGIVTQVLAEEGNLASAQTPIAKIVNLDTVEIDSTINELQVNKVSVGDEVQVLIPAVGTKIYTGNIKSISLTMDEMSKAYPLTIVLENKDHKIKAGMYAELEIVTDTINDAIIVPARAVIQRNGSTKVFVIQDGKAVEKEVETGLSNGEDTVILRGLSAGEEVIIKGNEDVVRGDPVKVVGRGEK